MLVKKITLIIALNAEMKPRPSLKSQLFDMSLNFRCGNYSIDDDYRKSTSLDKCESKTGDLEIFL